MWIPRSAIAVYMGFRTSILRKVRSNIEVPFTIFTYLSR